MSFPEPVRRNQWDIGIKPRLGDIWVDSQEATQRDYRRVLAHLGVLYQVSRKAIEVRLRQLNIVKQFPLERDNVYRIGDILDDLVRPTRSQK